MLFLIAAGGGRLRGGQFGGSDSSIWRGVSIAAGFLLFTLAIREYVGRFDLLFDQHPIFSGVSYTDAHVTILGMLFISVALVIGAVIAFAGGVLKLRVRWLLAAIAPAVVCYVIVALAGWYMTTRSSSTPTGWTASGLTSWTISPSRARPMASTSLPSRSFPPRPRLPQPIRNTIRRHLKTSASGTWARCRPR